VLDLGGMLESGIDDGSQEFGLEEKVLETRRVDANVMTLLFAPGGGVFGNISDFLRLYSSIAVDICHDGVKRRKREAA